ncbi:MAG: hypothetical protein J6X39_02275 [Bacteroidales bacterium]|nr:hypothetical protein [Bacteroidales bacterium]
MKKSIVLVIAAAICLAGCSLLDNQSTPKGYVKHCVRILDKNALYADTPEWKDTMKAILSEDLQDMETAHNAVARAARVAGGKHSQLLPPVKDTASYNETVPEVQMIGESIAYVYLPAHSGVKVSDSLYTYTILNFLKAHTDAKGVVIDLRDNTGGNMYPMIAALSPVIPDGDVIRFKNKKRTTPIPLEYITNSQGVGASEKFPAETPIAVLTNDWTASSGEATLLCFRGLPNVKTFGTPTAGYASANVTYPLADGYTLLVTTSCDMARTGEVFCDDPIAPEVETNTPLKEAVNWLLN